MLRRIGVLTSDFSLYHDLVRYLRERRIPFQSLSFGETLDASIGILVTSWRDAVGGKLPEGVPVVAVSEEDDVASAVTEAARILEGIRGYHEVVVGIDPGKRPGVAVLGDGRVLHTAQVFSVRDVGPLVRGLLGQFPADHARVRLGHGAPRERDAIRATLKPLEAEGVMVEVVDETGTTPPTGTIDLPPDVAAALRIARTPGRGEASLAKRRVSAGQVREIQRESRLASGGRVTISREDAERVVRGETTLQEAVSKTARQRKSRSSSRSGSKGSRSA